MALSEKEISSFIQWNSWNIVFVKSKEDHMKVRTGIPQKTFWDIWRDRKEEIKALGIYVKKIENLEDESIPPQWVVNQWKDASDKEKAQAKSDWENKQNQEV